MHTKALVYTITQWGPMIVPFKDPWVGASLVGMGEYSPIEVDFLGFLCDPSQNTIDVGANLGATAIPLGQRSCHVYAFEPVPYTNDLLRANIELTNANVTALAYAATDANQNFTTDGNEDNPEKDLGSITLSLDEHGHIKGRRLDCPTLELNNIGLIKMDIEGAEPGALRGAKGIIERDKPYVFYEALSETEGNEAIAIMREYGYEQRWFISPIFCQENFKNLTDNPWGMACSFNIIAYPPEKHIELFDELPKLDEVKCGGGTTTADKIIAGLGMRDGR